MKKTIFIFLLTITFLLTGCSNGVLTKISYDELSEKLNNKETFVVYFSSMDSNLENTLNDALSENNLEGFKVDTSKIGTYTVTYTINYKGFTDSVSNKIIIK